MSAYLEPIKIALFLFPVLSFFLAVPYMIYQYHTYGSVNKKRTLIIYSFIFYLMVIYFLVILPLPSRESVTTSYREMIQLRPFGFVNDFFKHTKLVLGDPKTYLPALSQGVVTQPIFNILMTIPFGMYLRFYFKKSLKEVFIYSLVLSMFFELTQLSGLYGIYSGPYRLFDVDDLMLNTFGGFLGYYVAPLIGVFFPSRDVIDEESYQKATYVSYIRRFVSFIGDMFLIKLLITIIQIGFSLINVFIIEGHPSYLVTEFIIFIIYFGFFAYQRNGQTMMQKFLHIRLEPIEGKLKLTQVLKRTVLIYVFMLKFSELFGLLQSFIMTSPEQNFIALLLYLSAFFLFQLTLLGHILFTAIKKTHIMFYDKLSGIRVIGEEIK